MHAAPPTSTVSVARLIGASRVVATMARASALMARLPMPALVRPVKGTVPPALDTVERDLFAQRYLSRRGDAFSLKPLGAILREDARGDLSLINPHFQGEDGLVYRLQVEADGTLAITMADPFAALEWHADFAEARAVPCSDR